MASTKKELRMELAASKKREEELAHKELERERRGSRTFWGLWALVAGWLIGFWEQGWVAGLVLGVVLGILVWFLVGIVRSAFGDRLRDGHIGSWTISRDGDSSNGGGAHVTPPSNRPRWLRVIAVILLVPLVAFAFSAYLVRGGEVEQSQAQSAETPISTEPNVEQAMTPTAECTRQAITSFMALGGARATDGEVAIGDEVDWTESDTKPEAVEYLFGKAQLNNMLVGDPDPDLYVPVQVLEHPLAMRVDATDGQQVSIVMQPGDVMWAYVDNCVPVQENTLHLGERTGAYFD